jgi:hypothetical protein
MEFVAKNVGIRRANGDWILPMAMDTILSFEFWQFLYSKQLSSMLEKDVLYRAFRVDVDSDIPADLPLSNVQSFLHSHVYRIWGNQWDHDQLFEGPLNSPHATAFMRSVVNNMREGIRFQEACGDFQLMHRDSWWKIRAYWEYPTYGNFDSVLYMNAEKEGFRFGILDPPILVYHQFHKSGGFAKRSGSFNMTNDRMFLNDKGEGNSRNPNGVQWGGVKFRFDEQVFLYGEPFRQWDTITKSQAYYHLSEAK